MHPESTPRLLIVEDDELHVELIRRAMAGGGVPMQVSACRTLREAHDRLAQEPPELILADLKLPDGSGTDLLPPEGSTPACGIVLMTSHGNEHTAVEALKRGALDYLVKSDSIFAEMPTIAARALRTWSLVAERRRAEEALRENEERYRKIASEAYDPIVMCDARGNISFWNDAATRAFGYGAEEALGRNVHELLTPPGSRLPAKRAFTAVATAPGPAQTLRVEGVAVRKDGVLIDVEIAMSFTQQGGEWSVVSIIRDITDRKRVEANLRASEEKYRLLVEDLSEAVFAADAEGRVTYMSPAIERLVGYTPADILGHSPLDFVHPEDAAGATRSLADTLTGGADAANEYRVVAKSGDIRWLHILARPVVTEGVVTGVRGLLRDVTESRGIEERLRMTQFSLDHAADPVFWIREDGTFDYANETACRRLGLSLGELRAKTVMDVDPDISRERWRKTWARAASQGPVTDLAVSWRSGSGRVYADLTMTHMEFGRHRYLCVFAREATERHLLEQQLRQAQKMEAIGRLAGGVAHDFNNHLFAINLFADLLARELTGDRKLLTQVLEIKQAGEQAARLTQQLLAFSRQQVLKPEVLDLNAEINRIHAMLRRIIGEDVTLRVHTGRSPAFAKVDPTQMDQVILNLVVNARDAMPGSGTITIDAAREVILRAVPGVESDILPGSYVTLTVSDTGVGMDRNTLAQIFDPFFTTKDKSKGTGLGLSMVLGVVKQSQGHITVDSEPGRGTRFKIFFPEVPEPDASEGAKTLPQEQRKGTETILLVEDEEPVRRVLCTALRNAGYRVLEADCGPAAVDLAQGFDGTIHLLLTDVVMPGMNGVDLSKRVIASRPGTRTLFMSGYADLEALGFATFADGTFLQKPCPLETLLDHVRALLES